jgi:6,7-dimethyl-8-ribityllumazine synthase
MPKLCILIANFYAPLAEALHHGAVATLTRTPEWTHVTYTVPGALELPLAMARLVRHSPHAYDGYVLLGCVLRGETYHFDLVCDSTARAAYDLASTHAVPMGFGVITADTMAQALHRASPTGKDMGGKAVAACIALHGIGSA